MFGKLDPAWRLEPFPSITLRLPGSYELVIPYLRDGSLTSLHGITRFLGPKSIEFADGTVLEDIDAVVLCTGYSADWSLASSFIRTSKPAVPSYGGSDIYRLWMNLFPPEYADSCVLLCYSAFGKSNGFSFSDITAQAISNVWRGVETVPSKKEMEDHIDEHQRWVAQRWEIDHETDTSAVKQWEFQGWLHEAAGSGMENPRVGLEGMEVLVEGSQDVQPDEPWHRDRALLSILRDGKEEDLAWREGSDPPHE